jgi:hypothetical protein
VYDSVEKFTLQIYARVFGKNDTILSNSDTFQTFLRKMGARGLGKLEKNDFLCREIIDRIEYKELLWAN